MEFDRQTGEKISQHVDWHSILKVHDAPISLLPHGSPFSVSKLRVNEVVYINDLSCFAV